MLGCAYTSTVFLCGRGELVGHRHSARGPGELNAIVKGIVIVVMIERSGWAQLVLLRNIETLVESERCCLRT